MALIELPDNKGWIDIPAKGYGIAHGKGDDVIEDNITDSRVVELLREHDVDDPYTYLPSVD